MKTTNTRKNRGKKSRNFKNTQKGGKRNKLVFNRKKTLRGKKQYTRRNRWKKNIHRGRQFLDVMVGGAQNASEPVKISENMVIYTLLDQKYTGSTKSRKFFTMYEYNNLNMLIFFIIELNDEILLNESNTLDTKFSQLEEKFLNSLNTHNCQEFDIPTELSKYDIFVYSFNKELSNLFELVTHVSFPQKGNTDIFDELGPDLGLDKVNFKLQEYDYESIYKLPNNSVGPKLTPQFISENNDFIKERIQENYRKKYAVFIEMEQISINNLTRAAKRQKENIFIQKYLEDNGFSKPNKTYYLSIKDILTNDNTYANLKTMTPENLTEKNVKRLIKFFNCNKKVIFPQIINVKNGADDVGTITPEISYLEFKDTTIILDTRENDNENKDKYWNEPVNIARPQNNNDRPKGSFKKAKFIKKKLEFKYKNNFMVYRDTQEEQKMDIIGLLLIDKAEENIIEFKKINNFYYNLSCEDKKYFCAPILCGSFKEKKKDIPIIISEYGGMDSVDYLNLLADAKEFNEGLLIDFLINLISNFFNILKILNKKQLVHRDIKPENFLYNQENQENKVKLIDFDLMVSFDDFIKNNIGAGTPGYTLFNLNFVSLFNHMDEYSINSYKTDIVEKYDLFSTYIIILEFINNLVGYDLFNQGELFTNYGEQKKTAKTPEYINIISFIEYFTNNPQITNKNHVFYDKESLVLELTILKLFPSIADLDTIVQKYKADNDKTKLLKILLEFEKTIRLRFKNFQQVKTVIEEALNPHAFDPLYFELDLNKLYP